MDSPDHDAADSYSTMGENVLLVVDAAAWKKPVAPIQSTIIGWDEKGALPAIDFSDFDVLLTSATNPPRPWVEAPSQTYLNENICRWPLAATILCQSLKLSEKLNFAEALTVESLAYSTLLGGEGFLRWFMVQDATAKKEPNPLLIIEREADHITITLNNPNGQNAMTATMRDALFDALANALDDPTAPRVSLRAAGKCFSTGGAISEFGSADDLAVAHLVRTLRSCARLIDALGPRADVQFHGACIGSGLEVFAAASRRTARPDTWFQLPELSMGLVPGAGGTASVTRAIGRHRTAWMVLSGKRLSAEMALNWGLIQEIKM